ncbi:MAG: hypothetical protein KGJ39_06850 [Acidobacteriota bacterium]|nr:hypothetical protein [Acidobacteriota bacterium]
MMKVLRSGAVVLRPALSRTLSDSRRGRLGAVIVGLVALFASVMPVTSARASSVNVDFAQCANGSPFASACNWINGDLNGQNSTYYEGDATTQVVGLSGLAAGTYTLQLTYATTLKNRHAYDFLTDYNESNTFLSAPKDVCAMAGQSADVTACQASAVSVTSTPIVQDASIAPTVGSLTAYSSASYQMIGGFLASATAPTVASVNNGTDSTVSVTFVVGGTGGQATTGITSGSGASTTYTAYLTFGAHVASEVQWGPGTGAGSISGSPYHVVLGDLAYDGQTISVGGQDNQMKSNVGGSASISLAKSANPSTYSAAGQTITYTYVITNTGSSGLASTQYSLSDSLIDGSLRTNCGSPTALSAGASVTCTRTYSITSGDMGQASVTNTALAFGGGLTSNTDQATVYRVVDTPSISVTKQASESTYTLGDVITYTYVITNDGNATLTGVALVDSALGAITSCSLNSGDTSTTLGTLAAGDAETCSATHTVTTGDVTNGSIANTATATGYYGEQPFTDQASVTVNAAGASIGVTKSANATTYGVGDVITYTYVVTNTGAVTLTNVALSDDQLGTQSSCASASLSAGSTTTCTATYTTQQVNVDNGSLTNVATATGWYNGVKQTATDTVTLTAQTGGGASISVTKAPAVTPVGGGASVSSYTKVGDVVTYTYVVTNTGKVTLSSVALNDNKLGAITCPSATLAPAGTETCTASYTVTQGDLDRGSIANTATVSGSHGGTTVQDSASATVNAAQTLGIVLVKTPSPTVYTGSNQTITYTYVITNTGNVTLGNVTLNDNKLGAITCPSATLAPQASETCTASYVTTSADVGAGSVTNQATARGYVGERSISASATKTVTYQSTPNYVSAIGLAKSASPTTYAKVGDVITYTYVITNTGNVALASTQYTVTDNKLGSFACGAPTSLAVGASLTCTKTYVITAADVAANSVSNTATASGGGLTSAPASATVATAPSSAIGLVKTASPSTYAKAGDVITYTYTITNSGNVALAPAYYSVSDDKLGTISLAAPTALAVGQSVTLTGTYTITPADVTTGSVTNTATASGGGLTSSPASATVNWVGEVTTTIHVNPATTIPPVGPATGAGGAAHSDGGVIMGVGALMLLAGLALAGVLLRRRRV